VKIYTKTGDAGETSLFDSSRVSKADARVDAYGEVDELNACLGGARASLDGSTADLAAMLVDIQRDLFAVGSRLADPSSKVARRIRRALVDQGHVARLEEWIDRLELALPPLRRFILPGGTDAAARLHVARAVCRRAERRVVALGPGAVEPVVVVYLNRLSDLLFVMARAANQRGGAPDEEW
jgi:cob(I)alamin adenosyltransferase